MKKLFKALFFISVALCSCKGNDYDFINNLEYKEPKDNLYLFYKNDSIDELKTKKVDSWIFSCYKKDNLNGLLLINSDSLIFANDNFFPENAANIEINFTDRYNAVFKYTVNSDNYTCIFNLNEVQNNWLLVYAEKKTILDDEYIYSFTGDISPETALNSFILASFDYDSDEMNNYVFKKKNYLEKIEEQVKYFRSSKIKSFENIFTAEHARELVHYYPVSLMNVIYINNIAYYLEQMDIVIPSVSILESIISVFPNRVVSYLNMGDALAKLNLITKSKEYYKQYIGLMKNRGKAYEIPQRLLN